MSSDYINMLQTNIRQRKYVEIQEIFLLVRGERDWRKREDIKRKLNDILEKEYQNIIKDITNYHNWDVDKRNHNMFLIASYLVKRWDLKTNQIRKFLDKFRFIHNNKDEYNREKVVRLRPLLAYLGGRSRGVLPFVKILDPMINLLKDDFEDFEKLFRFIEGIVAYHKFLGGD